MLVDAAKHGDIEIPVFCYEPKLGEPVGACRMCLVEIEGIPKLQTACSTPVRDGMVVYTQTDQVKEAQNAVVEFLLVNHPLDCPVCDKGGECPLQDISMGWGPDRSRVVDTKRHFEKPIPLSPLIAIDRERCILCYRCVRFSQEVSEDEQLQLLERGDRHLRRHLRRPALHRPLPRQHHRALPGRRADLLHLPLPGPALGHRAGGLGLHALPEPVQRRASRSATSRSKRVLARDNARGRRRLALRQRPLRLPDVRRQDRVTEPMCATGGASPVELGGGDREAAAGPAAAGGRRSPRSSATPPTRRATSSSGILREALGSAAHRLAPPRGRSAARRWSASPGPSSAAGLATSTTPTRSSCSAPTRCTSPILDLRIRKAVRRNGARCWSPPSGPAPSTAAPRSTARYAPPGAPPRSSPSSAARWSAATGATGDGEAAQIAELLRDAPRVVVVWGERLGWGGGGAGGGRRALLGLAEGLGPPEPKRAPGLLRGPPRSPTRAGCARSAACPTPVRA